jgi:periplasmic protein TonB
MPASNAARESKAQPSRPAPEDPEKTTKGGSDYYHSESAQSTSVANWRQQDSELPIEKRASRVTRKASSTTSRSSAQARNFMGQGLMGHEQHGSSSSTSRGRTPLIVGMAVLILAGICAAVFFLRQGATGVSVAKADAVSQPSATAPSATKSAHAPVRAQHEESAQVPGKIQAQANSQVQPVAVEQPQSIPTLAPVPAVVTSPVLTDARTGSANVRRQEENARAAKQLNPASSRRPAIPNLKLATPIAPSRNAVSLGQGAAPVAEIASTESVGGVPSAGLLTSAGKTFNPPAPPPSTPAPTPVLAPAQAARIVRDPKLISSTRLVYPTTARQTHIEGSVTVSASIDEYGKVVGAKALSGPMVLRQAAVDSVSQWKYSPELMDGKAVPSQVTVTVEFRLN